MHAPVEKALVEKAAVKAPRPATLNLSERAPRGVWDLSDDAFDVFRRRFVALAGAAAVAFVPAYIGYTWLLSGAYAHYERTIESQNSDRIFGDILEMIGRWALALPLLGIARTLQTAATAALVEAEALGEPISIRIAWSAVRRRAGALTAISLIDVILGLISLCTGGLGNIVLAVFWTFVPIVTMLEHRRALDSIRRGFRLATREFGRTAGMVVLLWALQGLLVQGLSSVIQLALTLLPSGPADHSALTRDFVINSASTALGTILMTPLSAVACTLLYYDIRIRQEGLDMQMKARDLEVELAPEFYPTDGGLPLPGEQA